MLESVLPKIVLLKPLCKLCRDPCATSVDALSSYLKAAVTTKLRIMSFRGLGAEVIDRLKKDTKLSLLQQCLQSAADFVGTETRLLAWRQECETRGSGLTPQEQKYFDLNYQQAGGLVDTSDLTDAVGLILSNATRKVEDSYELAYQIVGELVDNPWHQKVDKNDLWESVTAVATETVDKITAKSLNAALDDLNKDSVCNKHRD